MIDALRRHWAEYLIEAAGLGFFMISLHHDNDRRCIFRCNYRRAPVREG